MNPSPLEHGNVSANMQQWKMPRPKDAKRSSFTFLSPPDFESAESNQDSHTYLRRYPVKPINQAVWAIFVESEVFAECVDSNDPQRF
jgi:hypothetical protein